MKKILLILLLCIFLLLLLAGVAISFFIMGYWLSDRNHSLQSFNSNELNSSYALKLTNTVNDWRNSQNLKPYESNYFLCALANQRSLEVQSDWSHDGFWKYVDHVRYKDLGENLSKGYTDTDEALYAWLNSPPHKENLMKDYQYGCIRCTNGYCAHEFANF